LHLFHFHKHFRQQTGAKIGSLELLDNQADLLGDLDSLLASLAVPNLDKHVELRVTELPKCRNLLTRVLRFEDLVDLECHEGPSNRVERLVLHKAPDKRLQAKVILGRRPLLLRVVQALALPTRVAHRHLIELRLEAQLGEVLVDLELVLSQSTHVRSELHGELVEHYVDFVVAELAVALLAELAPLIQSLIDHLVFFDLRVSFRNDGVFDHLAAELKILLRGFLGDLNKFFLMVLKIEAQVLLLLGLAILLVERHAFVELGTAQARRRSRVEASFLQSVPQIVIHLDAKRLAAGD